VTDPKAVSLLEGLAAAHLADACLRLKVPLRVAPHTMRPAAAGMTARGRARPVKHVGSVDVFLEALQGASMGDVLVVDNGGRFDESCIGDLVTLEVHKASLAGIVIWGLHRDNDEVAGIGLPMFSLGVTPAGPQRLDKRPADTFKAAMVGSHRITASDLVVADADGVLFLPEAGIEEIARVAAGIRDTEHHQAATMRGGRSLRQQLNFDEFLAQNAKDPAYSFRIHLRGIGGSIEE
jgi:regulator of RNase E activity RraA